jgi:hypothetical protein
MFQNVLFVFQRIECIFYDHLPLIHVGIISYFIHICKIINLAILLQVGTNWINYITNQEWSASHTLNNNNWFLENFSKPHLHI